MKRFLFILMAFCAQINLFAGSENIQWKWSYSDHDDTFIDLIDENTTGFVETNIPNSYAGKLVVELPDQLEFKHTDHNPFFFDGVTNDSMFKVDVEKTQAIISLSSPIIKTVPSSIKVRLNSKSIKGKKKKDMLLDYMIEFKKTQVQTEFISPVTGKVYSLVFNDEFNDHKIDPLKWKTRSDHNPFTRRGVYNDKPYYVLCDDDWTKELNGELRLEVSRYPSQDFIIMTGGILSLGRFMPKYGYYETKVSFRDCSGEGYWPAFWLMFDEEDRYKEGTEIDIFEYIPKGNQIFHTLHWYKKNIEEPKYNSEIQHTAKVYDKNKQEDEHLSSTKYFKLADAETKDHTFAVEWTPEELIFYTDGKVTRHITRENGEIRIPHAYQMVFFSCSAGEWGGHVMNNTAPAYVYFDYCRCYQSGNQDAIYTINGIEKKISASERQGKL